MTELTTVQIVLASFLCLVTGLTIFGNSLVLYAFARGQKNLKSPAHYFLVNLALADLLVGLLVMPFLAPMSVTRSWYFGETYCTLWEYIHYSLCASSLLSMTAVCVERLIAVKHPVKHKLFITKKAVKFSIVVIWGLAMLGTAVPLSLISKVVASVRPRTCVSNLRTGFMLYTSICLYWVPVTGLVLVYWQIYSYARIRTQRKDKDVRVTNKILLFVAIVLIFYCPLFTTFFLRGIDSPYFSIKLFGIAGWIRYSCCCLNPFLYALVVPGYRSALLEIICCRQHDKAGNKTPNPKQNGNSFPAPENTKPPPIYVNVVESNNQVIETSH